VKAKKSSTGRAKARPGRPSPAGSARAAAASKAPAQAVARSKALGDVRPLRDRILVKRVEEQEQRSGGIIIPDTAKEKPQQAEVVAVGSGRVLEDGSKVPLAVKAGDRVLVGKWSGSDIKIDGVEYLILKEDEVLGVLE
jgi:chaperonin GroES